MLKKNNIKVKLQDKTCRSWEHETTFNKYCNPRNIWI